MNDNGFDNAWQETPSEPFLGSCDNPVCAFVYILLNYIIIYGAMTLALVYVIRWLRGK